MSIETVPALEPPVPARPPSERLPALDLLRGIAVLGILPANVPFFSGAISPFTMQPLAPSGADHLAMVLMLLFVFGKCVALLSILFGAGLALQVWKARAAGRPFARSYIRRMVILFLIGLAHGLFLWFGDILSSYAIVALLALIFCRFSQRLVLWTMAGCLTVVGTWMVLSTAIVIPTGKSVTSLMPGPPATPDAQTTTVDRWVADLADWYRHQTSTETQTEIWRNGTLGAMILNRAVYLAQYMFQFWIAIVWLLLSCFLLGIYLMRRGLFSDFDGNRAFIRKLIRLGLAVGVPLQLLSVIFYSAWPETNLHIVLPYTLAGLPLAVVYLGLGLSWTNSGHLPQLLTALQAVGRTALSNYILQSILCNLIYYRFGLQLYGELGHAANLAVVACIWMMEIAWSVLWLHYFQMGPVEWLWRSLAERKSLPLRRVALTPTLP